MKNMKKRECDIKEMLFDDPEKAEISDSWDNILFSVKDGTYKTKYSIGNYKPLALKSGEICYMQIAAFDTDILAYDSGKAAITWISIEPLDEPHRINSKAKKSFFNKLYEENTGAVGGWEKSEKKCIIGLLDLLVMPFVIMVLETAEFTVHFQMFLFPYKVNAV